MSFGTDFSARGDPRRSLGSLAVVPSIWISSASCGATLLATLMWSLTPQPGADVSTPALQRSVAKEAGAEQVRGSLPLPSGRLAPSS